MNLVQHTRVTSPYVKTYSTDQTCLYVGFEMSSDQETTSGIIGSVVSWHYFDARSHVTRLGKFFLEKKIAKKIKN